MGAGSFFISYRYAAGTAAHLVHASVLAATALQKSNGLARPNAPALLRARCTECLDRWVVHRVEYAPFVAHPPTLPRHCGPRRRSQYPAHCRETQRARPPHQAAPEWPLRMRPTPSAAKHSTPAVPERMTKAHRARCCAVVTVSWFSQVVHLVCRQIRYPLTPWLNVPKKCAARRTSPSWVDRGVQGMPW